MNSSRRHLRRDSQESLSLVCQNYQCSKRSRLLIFGPGRSEKTPEGRNLPLHLSRRFSERRQDAFVEVALSKPGDSKAQTLACFRKRFAEEFAFRRMNQDRKSTRLNSSHLVISYAVFCL